MMFISITALVSLLPASLQVLRLTAARDSVFWAVLAVAVVGPTARVFGQGDDVWQTGLASALWVSIAATMALFAVIAILSREAWRLMPLVAPYMLALGVIATVWQQVPGRPLAVEAAGDVWFAAHITVSVATYALVTIAAIAALAAWLQERALKRKQPTSFTRSLPSVADCEALVVRVLAVGEGVLALGLATGMALNRAAGDPLLMLDHKTVLVVATFVIIGGLLVAHYASGMRGRQAARIVLLAYLLLTLGYPGLKFVTDVLMA